MTSIGSNKEITIEQAADYINRSIAGNLVGRVVGKGPFKGLTHEAALERAIGKVKSYLAAPNPVISKDLAKAMTKIQDLSPQQRIDAGKTARAFERGIKPSTHTNPLEDRMLLESLSDELGIDLVHLREVIETKYPHLLDGMKMLVKMHVSGEDDPHEKIYQKGIAYDLVALDRALCRTGDFDLKIKTRPEILVGAARRVGTSSINLFVNVPIGIGRIIASPFIAIAGGIMTAAGHEKGRAITKSAGVEAALGAFGALSAAVGFIGTVVGAVVDPIAGKEIVRETQLHARALLEKGIVHTTFSKIYKYPPQQLLYQTVLKNITSMTLPRSAKLTEKKISMWHPAQEHAKLKEYIGKAKAIKGGERQTLDEARIERIRLRSVGVFNL